MTCLTRYTGDVRILVALSGGIDSSTVAFLLKEQGHELIGVRFLLWSDPLAPALAQVLPSKCCTAQNASRAQWVTKHLSIPFHVVDLQEEFKREVVDPFLDGYRQGCSPNPCICCNRTMKFGRLLTLAEELGCEALATGHYARTARERLGDETERTILLEAVDGTKDQSYYLYGLSQEQLRHALFPLGTMRKSEVYALAQAFGIPFDKQYRESQDLCFFPEKTPHAFLKRHLRTALKPGEITRRDGSVVGTHEGLPLYTLGQRKGLGIGGLRVPLEVVEKNVAKNLLVVAPRGEVKARSVLLTELRWISWKPREHAPQPFECRSRSLAPRSRGTLTYEGKSGTFLFDHPLPPQAPGQSLVLYRGEEVVGGGVVC